ncbi:hypothetical protein TCAL_08330 [Tigriopus californicus]|uniref:mRNA m(6)A methyltransferase n=1 Tax=Tigriopus californicus TaxID=6832 RepID=A0A553PNB0_TIGCA|nr:N6-adenosine-methyltransferase subunit METTL3-like [Tigriopus californicus]TRY79163.1 hypothetical protein TCAL_08330 [Tigriopus californicus]|eukprot:TCALIF_08330-PA protein Name:"Similar to METTL3 N6-adenosine-methyltransferase 70 kDa subunit (Homo sapiens)" AED:0.02 eAED:0.03 QI:0/-1/0/1/-1/1/1/0/501
MDPASSEAISAELQAVSSKRAFMKDKLKKRREFMGSILSQSQTLLPPDLAAIAQKSKAPTAGPSLSTAVPELSGGGGAVSHPLTVVTPNSLAPSSPSTMVPVPAESGETESKRARASGEAQDDILSLLSTQSAKEKQDQEQRDEILSLLSQPTAKERTLMDAFRSQSGGGVREFCTHSTKSECMRVHQNRKPCEKLHFAKILQAHTDESLGDCSFLNTCFHMDTCKYIHYEVDADDLRSSVSERDAAATVTAGMDGERAVGSSERATTAVTTGSRHLLETLRLVPPQWVQCDLRSLDLSVLGKFSVVMADPPWDIHMELPYGTMSDDEMRHLPVPSLQDEGLIFLWVTGRAMELGRECLKLWGYERVDELIWVKTNQLQRIIRTGRTGHWLNHGKEHCLVGMKGDLKLNRGLDCDVIVAEVRATSHKPDEIYGIIERLSPGTRKIELFGRPHNVQPNWFTLGNQLDGVVIHDDEVLTRWRSAYPNGYELTKGFVLHARPEP